MKKRKNKTLRRILSAILLAALVAVLTAMPLIARQEAQEEFPISILSAQVENRELTLTLAGGGSFQSQENLSVTVPRQVKLTEFLVENGQLVREGDPIAQVDRVTVMQAIAATQQELEWITDQLEEARTQSSTQILTAPEGLVKAVYAKKGDSVHQVMLEYGCLAVISLDSRMMVTLNTPSSLSAGDSLTVQVGEEAFPGTVESNLEGTLVVTLPDENLAVGDSAQVLDAQGSLLGTGELEIHQSWKAMAGSGTVDYVYTQAGDTLRAGARLMQLTEPDYSADYRAMAALHREYEEQMLTLFRLYQNLTLRSPGEGLVSGIDQHSAQLLGTGAGWQVSLLANAPGGDPDAQYQNFAAQVLEITPEGITLRVNPQPFQITDYSQLPALPGTATMNQIIQVPGLMVFRQAAAPAPEEPQEPEAPEEPENPDAPENPDTPDAPDAAQVDWQLTTLTVGDLLVLAGSDPASFVWAVRAGSAPVEEAGPQQTPSIAMPSFGSYGGETTPPREAYTLDTVEVAAVTPTQELTLPIAIDQQDIHYLSVGQAVTVTAEALPGQSWEGTITQIGHIGAHSGGSSKFTVTVTLPWEGDMLPGMHAAVTIPLETVTGPAIPVAALGNGATVYTALDPKTGDPIQPVEVTTGLSDGEYVLLHTGPGAGTTVYYPYYEANTPRQ